MSSSEVAQYIKEYWKWFQEDLNIPSQPASPVERKHLLRQVEDNRANFESSANDDRGGKRWYTTMVGFPRHSSSTPIQNLHRIAFSKMSVRQPHFGRYLLCRIITPCIRMAAVQTVVEDPEGVAYNLSIYNFPTVFGSSLQNLDALFPRGTVIAIREPTLKAPSQDMSTHPLLRVDSPTDIIFVPSNSALLRSIEWRTGNEIPGAVRLPSTSDAWQQWGNEYYRTSLWFAAALSISHSLALDPEALALRLNRAEAYLRLQYYSGAAYDAQWIMSKVDATDTYADKALLRLAKARYGRGDYRGAAEDFLRWKHRHADDASTDSWIDNCRARMHEEKTGMYNWPHLFHSATRSIRVDAADFVGPLEVRRIQGRGGGRGMAAKRNIRTGELLLAVKPFASVYAEDLPENEGVITIDLLLGSTRERTDALLLSRIVEKIYGNPDLHDEVFHLYAGDRFPPPPHAYPPPHRSSVEVDPFEPKLGIDIAKLEAICTYNLFCPLRLENPRADERAKPTGLYTLPSMFNHSCVANATWYCIGDLMIVRAAESIPAGAEITIPYCVEESYVDRQAVLRKHMLSHCDCRLCKEDCDDGEAQYRWRHKQKAQLEGAAAVAMPLADMRVLEEQINATYAPTRSGLRPLSARALHFIAEKLRHSSAGNPHILVEANEHDMRALERYGFTLVREGTQSARGLPVSDDRVPTATSFLEPIEVMLRIAKTYCVLRDEANAARWLKAALWLTDASVGGGKELFMLLHKDLLRLMELQPFAARAL